MEDIDFKVYKTNIKDTNIEIYFFRDRFIGQSIGSSGIYEEEIINFLKQNFINDRLDGIFLDIGAHIGLYSCLISNLCPNMICYAFEPQPLLFRFLQTNTMNLFNVVTYNYAISNENSSGTLICDDCNSGHNFLSDKNDISFDKTTKIKVPIRKLDVFNIDFNRVKLIKLDIEGKEDLILNDINDKIKSGTLIIIEKEDYSNLVDYKLLYSYGGNLILMKR